MSLFGVRKTKSEFELHGIKFYEFDNSEELYKKYHQLDGHHFCSNFEYINKISLNPRYKVLYLESEFSNVVYVFIYDTSNEQLVAYDLSSYNYLNDNYHHKCDGIKFMLQKDAERLGYKSGQTYVDAVYLPKGLAFMEGKKYSRIRGNKNNFLHHVDEDKLLFIPYEQKYKQSVLELYDNWKSMSKENGNTFIVDARVFKDGLDNSYIHKFLLIYDNKLFGFISYILQDEWCYIYSMKSTRDIPNQNTYMVHMMWKYIYENHKEVKYINLGGIDNVDSKGTDYKMLLKPDYLLWYCSNVKVGD